MHRIGRTGRAGRSGEAILFVTPREKGMLRTIERATRQPISEMDLPSVQAVNDQRVSKFLGRISDTLAASDLNVFRELVERYEREHNVPAVEIAAALARKLRVARVGVDVLHGNKSQGARTRALDNFKRGKTRVLVATDVAARGGGTMELGGC